ncbi:hypothetical protein HHI36_001149 [Cryptolaemus montrouzieri]|uniref:Kinetochore protein NDC80 n=1 Tax=Cryptolaemus montrouzieri TaxID=559131 RepID=A0ABD2P6Y7_9CUCU
MRRSKSASNIPLPLFRRTLSSENLKKSEQGLKRASSVSNLVPPKSARYSSKSHLNVENRTSASSIGSASKAGPVSKRYTSTPSRNGSMSFRLLSPRISLTTQKINDKKFSTDQFKKICSLLQHLWDDFDPKSLKVLTIKTFVNSVSSLFREIDPRINITMENYKETVIKYLKLYKYPGPVSISLLKSANISHSWASIMAILGWLVDLIQISSHDDDDKLKKFTSSRMNMQLKGCETKGEFTYYLDELSGLDRSQYNILDCECTKLKLEKDQRELSMKKLQTKQAELSQCLDRMKLEITDFKEGNLLIKITNEIQQLQAELELKEVAMADLKLSLTKAQYIVSTQKYSQKDKLDLLKKIEDKQYSLDLKKKEIDNIRKLADKNDMDVTSYRRQIESEIHKINGHLLQLKLGLLNRDAKKIQLPDRGIHNVQFLEKVEEIRMLLNDYDQTISNKLIEAKEIKVAVQSEWQTIFHATSQEKTLLSLLQAKMQDMKKESKQIIFDQEIFRKEFEMKMETLIPIAPEIELLKKQKAKLQVDLQTSQNEIKKLSLQSIDFFKTIHDDTIRTAGEMRSIMLRVLENGSQAQEKLEE